MCFATYAFLKIYSDQTDNFGVIVPVLPCSSLSVLERLKEEHQKAKDGKLLACALMENFIRLLDVHWSTTTPTSVDWYGNTGTRMM